MRPDYYELLECKRGCSTKEIKSAYHRLVAKFHPDRNPAPGAADFTARLNEAYEILGDERQRSLYDAWLRSSEEPRTTAESGSGSRAEAPQVKCSRCGRQDETIRLTLMYYVISLLVVTQRKGTSGLWCQRCRIVEAAKWTLLSGVFGWWGIPWGPIYTIHALFVNGKGGSQPRPQNATILRVLAYQLYQQGKLLEALVALREAIRLEPNTEASQLFEYLRQQIGANTSHRRGTALTNLAMTAAPSLLVIALISYFVYRVSSEPSGYQAHYNAPKAMSAVPDASPASRPKSKANDLIADLATVVETRAPVVGTHYEGAAMIQDHELDRSKFDEVQLYRIANSIGAELHSAAADPDGFLASAYFNAELFALSVDLAKRFDDGQPIAAQAEGVLDLGKDPAVKRWLQSSRFFTYYAALCSQLRSYSRRYHPGVATTELMQDYDREHSQVENLKERLDELRRRDDINSFNALVSDYNARIRHLNAVAAQGKFQALASRKLDLAFNRCLDSGILMSKFQKVDLASHAAEIDSLEDPDKSNQ
jgi:hypothetical protein